MKRLIIVLLLLIPFVLFGAYDFYETGIVAESETKEVTINFNAGGGQIKVFDLAKIWIEHTPVLTLESATKSVSDTVTFDVVVPDNDTIGTLVASITNTTTPTFSYKFGTGAATTSYGTIEYNGIVITPSGTYTIGDTATWTFAKNTSGNSYAVYFDMTKDGYTFITATDTFSDDDNGTFSDVPYNTKYPVLNIANGTYRSKYGILLKYGD
jgi:hypothetical protein